MRRRESLTAAIGQTPLVRLRPFEPHAGCRDLREARVAEPRGIRQGSAGAGDDPRCRTPSGRLRQGSGGAPVLLDATSGNTGIAYAMIAAARGHRVCLCVPANVTRERLQHPARVRRRAHPDRPDGGHRRRDPRGAPAARATSGSLLLSRSVQQRRQLARALRDDGGRDRSADRRAPHPLRRRARAPRARSSAPSRRLRELVRGVVCVAVQPDSPLHDLEGLKHLPTAIVPPIWDPTLADATISIATEDALTLTERLARDAGLFVGPSSGAALAGCLEIARRTTTRRHRHDLSRRRRPLPLERPFR